MAYKLNRKLFLYPLVLLLILVIGKGFYDWQQSGEPVKPHKIRPAAVQVAKVTTASVPMVIKAVGELQARRHIVVSPEIDGQVAAIHFTPGTFVRKGTLLVQLDDRVYQADLQSANAALSLAQANYRRYQALKASGALSKQQLDQVRAEFVEATAKAKLAQTYLSQTKIRAAFDGYVGAKNISIGDYVKRGAAMTTLVDRSLLLVNYHVPEKQLTRIQLGQLITLIVAKQQRKTYQGKVSYIAPSVSTDTHSVELQANITNANNELSPGLFVRIHQHVGMLRNAVVVPQQSIIPTITGSKVFVIKNDKAVSVNVETGMIVNSKVEINKGVQAGEMVVIAGQHQLKNGDQIRKVGS